MDPLFGKDHSCRSLPPPVKIQPSSQRECSIWAAGGGEPSCLPKWTWSSGSLFPYKEFKDSDPIYISSFYENTSYICTASEVVQNMSDMSHSNKDQNVFFLNLPSHGKFFLFSTIISCILIGKNGINLSPRSC